MTFAEFKTKLTSQLEDDGVKPSQFSIGTPEPFRMVFLMNNGQYQVFFMEYAAHYSDHSYSDLSQAVYDFCTRIVPTEEAKSIAQTYSGQTLSA